MYIANHYVKVNGRMLMKGESIPEDLTAEKIDWLMRAGAIHEGTPALISQAAMAEDTEAEAPNEEPDEMIEPEQEVEELEIDVMAGIVHEEPEKPAKKAPVRKQTARRKAN